MSRSVRITGRIALLLTLAFAGGISSASPATPSAVQIGDGEGVRDNRAVAAAWDAAFNTENIEAVMALYADGAVSMPPGFLPSIGKPAIRADFEFLFSNFDLHHQTTVVQLEVQGT